MAHGTCSDCKREAPTLRPFADKRETPKRVRYLCTTCLNARRSPAQEGADTMSRGQWFTDAERTRHRRRCVKLGIYTNEELREGDPLLQVTEPTFHVNGEACLSIDDALDRVRSLSHQHHIDVDVTVCFDVACDLCYEAWRLTSDQ